jgi:glycosyltransferase involved in cell wall biosynthesis
MNYSRSHPLVSVIIPHLNQSAGLLRCLTALEGGHRQPDEIIVVDNGSARPPTDICAQFGKVRLLHQPVAGPGLARNLGAEQSKGNILAFIDADCIPALDWLVHAERALQDQQVEILGGDVRIAYDDPKRLTQIEAYESIFAFRMDRYISRQGFSGTGNLVMRRRVFDRVGPFAGLKIAEDRDWGQRATRAGHIIHFIPDMTVFHPPRLCFSDLQVKWDRHIFHDMQRCNGRWGRLRWVFKALLLAASPIAEIPRVLVCKRVRGLSNRCKAFSCLTGIRIHRAARMIQMTWGGTSSHLLAQWNRSDAN